MLTCCIRVAATRRVFTNKLQPATTSREASRFGCCLALSHTGWPCLSRLLPLVAFAHCRHTHVCLMCATGRPFRRQQAATTQSPEKSADEFQRAGIDRPPNHAKLCPAATHARVRSGVRHTVGTRPLGGNETRAVYWTVRLAYELICATYALSWKEGDIGRGCSQGLSSRGPVTGSLVSSRPV